jgi:homocysteine S-methyltransferase
MATGADACLIMHNEVSTTGPALETARRGWPGPLGAYPESGHFEMPDWKFVDTLPDATFVAHCRAWESLGATIFGGCCGIGPSHIKALADAFQPHGVR